MKTMPCRLFFPASLLCSFFPASLNGQIAGGVDPAFTPNVSDAVNGVAIQADGKVLLGGDFTSVDGQPRNCIARLLPDGSVESTATFNTGTGVAGTAPGSSKVECVAVQADGKILLGGNFQSVDGQPRNNIARLLPDGAVESTATFNPGAGVYGYVHCVAIQADGKILLGGNFLRINEQPRSGIARLLPDGTVESTATFNPGTGVDGSSVYCVAMQPDGKILILGGFVSVNGQPRPGIARLLSDGTVESTATFNPGSGADGGRNAFSVAIQADGKILVGGLFNSVNGQLRNCIARLLPDGSVESTATFNPGAGASTYVHSVAVQADGKILLGGNFQSVDGQPRGGIARLFPDGTVEGTATFNPGTGASNGVNSVAVQADGKILLGGWFTSVNGQPRNKIARLMNDPGTQSLTAPSSARLLWMRGGAASEVSQVTFEASSDGGASWQLLGPGTRIAGGWELTGLSLSGSDQLRARGRTNSGFANGSSGLIEQTFNVPQIAVEHPPGSLLLDSSAPIDFGPVVAGNSSTKTVTISSTGTGDLTGLAVTKTAGGTPADFTISPLGATTLAPDASTTFTVTFSPSAPGLRTATLLIASNDEDENPFEINLTGSQATALEAWRQTYFGSPYSTGDGADLNDPDRDGIVNLLEFATGSDPLALTPPIGQLVKNGSTLEFTYARRKAALTEMTFVREFSESVSGTWGSTGSSSLETVLGDDGVLQHVKVTAPAGANGKRFVRLRVTRL